MQSTHCISKMNKDPWNVQCMYRVTDEHTLNIVTNYFIWPLKHHTLNII